MADEIKVEVKNVDDSTLLIFYHDRWNILSPAIIGNKGRIRSQKPAEIEYLSDVEQVLESINISDSKDLLDFTIKPEYKFLENLYGENLVAFKLGNTKTSTSTEIAEPKIEASLIPDTGTTIIDNDTHKQLSFPFEEENVGAAIFTRGKDLWIIFDQRKDFVIPETSFIQSNAQYPDPQNTILKISLKENLHPHISKSNGSWMIDLSDKSLDSQEIIKPVNIGESIVSIKNIGFVENIVTIRDSSVGDILNIVPLKRINHGIHKEENKLDYKILQSTQGIAIALIADSVKTSYNQKSASIDITSTYIQEEKIQHAVTQKTGKPIISFDLTELEEASYLQTREYLQNNLTLAHNNQSKSQAILSLAQFYFLHQLYHESLGLLNQLPKISPQLAKTKEVLMMKAIAASFVGQNFDAREIFTDLKQNNAYNASLPEIELWNKYNEYLIGNKFPMGLHNSEIIKSYPDYIYWRLILAELDIAVTMKDNKSADLLIKSLRKSKDLAVNNQIKYYKAKYFYLLNQVHVAQSLLEEVKNNAQDGKQFLRAELQLVKILYEQKRLNWISAVQRLNQLRFVWRGDKYEEQLLMAMGMAYQQNNDVINAIRTYKYIIEAFGKHTENNFFVTSQIVDLYRRIFLSNEMKELDDFSVVALFYEFKDYTPIGIDGDRVVLGIARRMLNLDLLEMAESILQHQVMYRLRGTERMVTANHLALVFLMDKKPVAALRILNDTDNENFGFAEHQSRTLLKAKALIDMEKYEDALSYIGDANDIDANTLKAEILFKSSRWADFISFNEPDIKMVLENGDKIEGDEGQSVLRLAIAYSMLNRLSDLAYLEQNIVTENKELKQILGFLKSSNNPIDPHNIDKMLNIDIMQNFLDNYRKLLFK